MNDFSFNFSYFSKEKTKKKRVIYGEFSDFLKAVGFDFEPYELQKNMVDFAGKKGKVKLLQATRGVGKTDLITIGLTLWHIHLYPKKTHLLIGSGFDIAKGWIEVIGSYIIDNPLLFDRVSVGKTKIRTYQNRTNKDATVAIGTIRTVLRGKHPNRFVLDDLLTLENESAVVKEVVKKKYSEILSLNKEKTEVTDIIVIGNPVSKNDLYFDLKTSPEIAKLEIWNDDLPTEHRKDIHALRASGVREYEIQANYFGNIIARDDTPFANISLASDVPFEKYQAGVAYIDPAFSNDGDYTALTYLAIDQVKEKIFVWGYCWKKSWYNCLEDMFEILKKHDPSRLFFEKNSVGETFCTVCIERGYPAPIGVINKIKKEKRIAAIQSVINHIHLVDNFSNKIYNEQILGYNYVKSMHDDAPDSLAGCLERVAIIRF